MLTRLFLTSSVLALTASLAVAQTSPPSMPGSAPSSASNPGPADTPAGSNSLAPADQRRGQAAQITLAQAIDTAEQQGQVKAISAEFEEDDGGQWEIKVIRSDGSLVEHTIDGRTGQIRRSETQRLESFFSRLKPADFQNARTSLKQATALAEQQGGGRAVEAEIERENNTVQYEITVVNGDRSTELKISADGQILKD